MLQILWFAISLHTIKKCITVIQLRPKLSRKHSDFAKLKEKFNVDLQDATWLAIFRVSFSKEKNSCKLSLLSTENKITRNWKHPHSAISMSSTETNQNHDPDSIESAKLFGPKLTLFVMLGCLVVFC